MKKLCVVTGSRAEYGQLRPFLRLARGSRVFELKLVVAGMHFEAQHGYTVDEVVVDGYPIAGRVAMWRPDDSLQSAAWALGMGVSAFAREFGLLKPDLVLVEGDRVEILAAALAAGYMGIPIAHGGGGDVTQTIDNSARHAISHFATLHFATTEQAADRLQQMRVPGEVHVTGALGIDAIMQMDWRSREATLAELGLPSGSRYLLVAFHPETGHETMAGRWMDNVLKACLATGLEVVVTYPNSDPGSSSIIDSIAVAQRIADGFHVFPSLGSDRYLHALKYADALVGNSSSGLYEAPSLKVPVVNMGGRQAGRPCAFNVVQAGYGFTEIRDALNYVLYKPGYQECLPETRNPFGDGHAAERMLAVIERRLGE